MAPSYLHGEGRASIVLNNMEVSACQEDILGELVEILIPETDSPGAKSLNLHLFVLKMVDDCHSKEDQILFGEEMRRLEAEGLRGTSFWEEDKEGKLLEFSKIVKHRCIQGYLNSKYVMQNELIYELVPGRYDGAYKIDRQNE